MCTLQHVFPTQSFTTAHAPRPQFIDRIENEDFQQWALELNGIWKQLGRQVSKATLKPQHEAVQLMLLQESASVSEFPERHSLIPVPHPFIVPGGRFREFYYW